MKRDGMFRTLGFILNLFPQIVAKLYLMNIYLLLGYIFSLVFRFLGTPEVLICVSSTPSKRVALYSVSLCAIFSFAPYCPQKHIIFSSGAGFGYCVIKGTVFSISRNLTRDLCSYHAMESGGCTSDESSNS